MSILCRYHLRPGLERFTVMSPPSRIPAGRRDAYANNEKWTFAPTLEMSPIAPRHHCRTYQIHTLLHLDSAGKPTLSTVHLVTPSHILLRYGDSSVNIF